MSSYTKRIDECILQADSEERNPLDIIENEFEDESGSEFYADIKKYGNRFWSIVYNFAESLMDYRDGLSDKSEKNDINDLLNDIKTLWKNTKNTQALLNLMSKLHNWLKEDPSSDNLDQTMKLLTSSYFFIKGLSLKMASISGLELYLVSAVLDLSEMQKKIEELDALIKNKYQKAQSIKETKLKDLTKNISDNVENAWLVIVDNQDDAIRVLSKNTALAMQLIKEGDEETKAFLSQNENIVIALINADKKNIIDLLALHSETVINLFKDNHQIWNKFVDDLTKDIEFASHFVTAHPSLKSVSPFKA